MASSSRTPRPRRRLKARSAAVQQPVAEFVRKNPAERSCHQQPRQGFRPRPRAHAADERLRPRHAHKDDEPCPATNGTHPSAESWVRSSGRASAADLTWSRRSQNVGLTRPHGNAVPLPLHPELLAWAQRRKR
jgi:hypothetical protein